MGFLWIFTLCLSLQAGARLDGFRQDGFRQNSGPRIDGSREASLPIVTAGDGSGAVRAVSSSDKYSPGASPDNSAAESAGADRFVPPPPSKALSLPSKRIRSAQRLQRRFDQLKAAAANDPAALWRIQFEEARRISERFCPNMKSLSLEKSFPLQNLALVYFYEKCPLKEEDGFSYSLKISRLPDWLQPFAARISYLRGKKSGDKKEILNAAIRLGRLSRFEELRLSYRKHALKLAKELQDPRAGEIEAALFQAAPRLMKQPGPKDWLAVADDWKKARRFPEALRYYLKILNSPQTDFQEKNRAFQQTAWIYKRQKKTSRLLKWSRRHERFLNSFMNEKDSPEESAKSAKEKSASAYHFYYKSRIQLAGRYWNLNQNKRALDLLDSVLQDKKAASVSNQARYMKGLILIEEERPEESLQELKAAAKDLRHVRPLRRLPRRRALRQARKEREERQKNGLSESGEFSDEKEKKKSAEFLLWEKVLWQKAWLLRQSGRLPEALKIFRTLTIYGSAFKTRAAFWAGEIQRESGRRFAAARSFHALRKEDPAGYYGLAASYRLGKPPLFSILSSSRGAGSGKTGRSRDETASIEERAANLLAQMENPELQQTGGANLAKANRPAAPPEGLTKAGRGPAQAQKKISAGLSLEDIYTVLWLKSLGEKEFLGDFLSFRQKKFVLGKKSNSFEATAALFSLYHAAGRHLDVFQAFFLQKPSLQKQLIDNGYGGFLFPLNFQEETERAALGQQVSPALLLSLIRQESAFNPRARSRADAFGLMQLIPSTARAAARKLRMPYRGYRDLYDPRVNIPLGAAHFKQLLSRYKGSLILAAAAYNAGGTPVKKWTAALDTSRPLAFIENIPWTETRVYIKLIIRNFIIYNKILRDLYTEEEKQAALLTAAAASAKAEQPKQGFFRRLFRAEKQRRDLQPPHPAENRLAEARPVANRITEERPATDRIAADSRRRAPQQAASRRRASLRTAPLQTDRPEAAWTKADFHLTGGGPQPFKRQTLPGGRAFQQTKAKTAKTVPALWLSLPAGGPRLTTEDTGVCLKSEKPDLLNQNRSSQTGIRKTERPEPPPLSSDERESDPKNIDQKKRNRDRKELKRLLLAVYPSLKSSRQDGARLDGARNDGLLAEKKERPFFLVRFLKGLFPAAAEKTEAADLYFPKDLFLIE